MNLLPYFRVDKNTTEKRSHELMEANYGLHGKLRPFLPCLMDNSDERFKELNFNFHSSVNLSHINRLIIKEAADQTFALT